MNMKLTFPYGEMIVYFFFLLFLPHIQHACTMHGEYVPDPAITARDDFIGPGRYADFIGVCLH